VSLQCLTLRPACVQLRLMVRAFLSAAPPPPPPHPRGGGGEVQSSFIPPRDVKKGPAHGRRRRLRHPRRPPATLPPPFVPPSPPLLICFFSSSPPLPPPLPRAFSHDNPKGLISHIFPDFALTLHPSIVIAFRHFKSVFTILPGACWVPSPPRAKPSTRAIAFAVAAYPTGAPASVCPGLLRTGRKNSLIGKFLAEETLPLQKLTCSNHSSKQFIFWHVLFKENLSQTIRPFCNLNGRIYPTSPDPVHAASSFPKLPPHSLCLNGRSSDQTPVLNFTFKNKPPQHNLCTLQQCFMTESGFVCMESLRRLKIHVEQFGQNIYETPF